ncbi:hypothetical protein TFLX_03295 [Thermoflexales bacterium]|nr:hypothetical protein TFLX_03295 [Thermoflexales bacterium]
MSETPDLKKIEQTLKRMTPEQFSAVCGELGLVEDLLGQTRDEQIKTLLGLASNLNRVTRAVRHVWPEAFTPAPVKPRREINLSIGPALGLLALIAIIMVGVLIVNSAINANSAEIVDYRVTSSPVPTQVVLIGLRTATFTPTPTNTPTRTPTNTPDIPGTLTATYAPTATPTRTPTRTPRATITGTRVTRTTTHTPQPTPSVRIVYPAPLLNKPASGTIVEAGKVVQMRWIVPGLSGLNPDERYRLRLRQEQQVVFERLTANNWWDLGGAPNGTPGTYNWSVVVVKVDEAGEVVGVISPESERWTVTW